MQASLTPDIPCSAMAGIIAAEGRTWSFGLGQNHSMPVGPAVFPDSPGPAYKLPPTLGAQAPAVLSSAPKYTFAPHGQRRRGLRRSKSELNKVGYLVVLKT